MTKFWLTPQFKQLSKEWEEKLKESGFDDHEQDADYMKQWHSRKFNFAKDTTLHIFVQNKIEYYRLAGQFLHEHKFKDATEHTIWLMHSEGKSYEQICKATGKKISTVRVRIEKLRGIMHALKNAEQQGDDSDE